MIDIVEVFSDAADDAGYEFAYGRKDILNFEATQGVDLNSGESVLLMFPFIEKGVVDNSIIHQWDVSTTLWLGRKFDVDNASGTFSELDETEKQKYDRRLKSLRDALATLIKTVFCSNDNLELTNIRIFRELNQFDEGIDFVTADINFFADDS